MATPLRRPGQERRQTILDAAREVIAADGVNGARIESIRKTAGASPSSVYHLFDGLDDIVITLLEETFDDLFTHLGDRVDAAPDARGVIRALVAAHIDWVEAHPRDARFMYEATGLRLPPTAAQRLGAFKLPHLARLTRSLEARGGAALTHRWAAEELELLLMGPTHEACRRFLLGAPISPEWMRAVLPDAAWRTVDAAGW